MSDAGGGVRVYRPEAEAPADGHRKAARPAPLSRLPRRWRPGMIALAVALVGAGILGFAFLYQSADHRVPVVMMTAAVPAGGEITAADLGTAGIAAGPGVTLIPGRQIGQVAGHIAATALQPGMLLTPADLGTTRPPAGGQVLVPVPVRPPLLPASGLAPGDHVQVVATPGAGGQTGSAGSSSSALTSPVQATVEAVNAVPDQDGFDVVDLLVAPSEGPAVAQQASTGQIALVITARGP